MFKSKLITGGLYTTSHVQWVYTYPFYTLGRLNYLTWLDGGRVRGPRAAEVALYLGLSTTHNLGHLHGLDQLVLTEAQTLGEPLMFACSKVLFRGQIGYLDPRMVEHLEPIINI